MLRSTDSGQNWTQLATGLPNNQAFGGLTQGGANNAQLLVASRGVYFYPGSGSAADPSRLLPILLVLLFFFLLYFFFVVRKRRTLRASALALSMRMKASASKIAYDRPSAMVALVPAAA